MSRAKRWYLVSCYWGGEEGYWTLCLFAEPRQAEEWLVEQALALFRAYEAEDEPTRARLREAVETLERLTEHEPRLSSVIETFNAVGGSATLTIVEPGRPFSVS